MRKVLAFAVFLIAAMCCAAVGSVREPSIRASAPLRLVAASEAVFVGPSVSGEEQRRDLMEAGRPTQPFHAVIFKTGGARFLGQLRACGPSGARASEKPVPSASLSLSRASVPSCLSRQSVLHQNLVARK